MKGLNKIITKEIFVNSFKILQEYIRNSGEDNQDINLILVSDYLLGLKENQVIKFYNKYIETGLLYSLPEFYGSDLVTIPKGVADIREYRFFSSFGLILYNSLGIFFAETCSKMLTNLNLEERGIYSYTPTEYCPYKKEWKANHKWKGKYKNFQNKILEKTIDSEIVLSLDISNFFGSIIHRKLINVINDYINAQIRKKYLYDGDSENIMAFYLLSMIGDNKGLPQGKKNFTSDYLAYLYMSKFDMELECLVKSKKIKFISCIRYVDDIHIFFKNVNKLSNKSIYRELSRIEHSISKWLYKELGLSINDKKTLRNIIIGDSHKKDFINEIQKRTSLVSRVDNRIINIDQKIQDFFDAVEMFSYPSTTKFIDSSDSKKKENLKNVFDDPVKKMLISSVGYAKMIKILKKIDLELSASQFNIFGALFGICNKKIKPYSRFLIEYFKKNFDPQDKRHIHIMLLSCVNILDKTIFKSLVSKNFKKLLLDDYGKYLCLYFFPKHTNILSPRNLWQPGKRVFNRIAAERKNSLRKYPFISKNIDHGFKPILLLKSDKGLDSVYAASCGYVHEFVFERWSVAFNKLQMVVHESVKYLFEINDIDKIPKIIEILNKNGLNISAYEKRDFLNFWDRRNFNPISHGSKNGLTSPEISRDELIKWEIKIFELLSKIFKLKK